MSREQAVHRGKSVPPRIRHIRLGLRLLGAVAPALAGRWVNRIWFSTRRYDEPAREARWRQAATAFVVDWQEGVVQCYRWGEQGPRVLLVHGWNGRGPQLGALAAPLLAAGYQVLALDLPGHGRSSGDSTNAFAVTQLLLQLQRQLGPFHGIVGHSFGALCAIMAVAAGLEVRGLVMVSAPARLAWLLDNFYRALGLSPAVTRAFEAQLNREFGADYMRQASALELAPGIVQPGLVIHDRDDRDVPLQQGESLAAALANAELMCTEKLGHRRILRDAAVLGRIRDFFVEL